jgi:hypothetical protein
LLCEAVVVCESRPDGEVIVLFVVGQPWTVGSLFAALREGNGDTERANMLASRSGALSDLLLAVAKGYADVAVYTKSDERGDGRAGEAWVVTPKRYYAERFSPFIADAPHIAALRWQYLTRQSGPVGVSSDDDDTCGPDDE